MRGMMRSLLLAAAVAAGILFWVSRPNSLPADALAGLTGDQERGARVYLAAGCRSCHSAPKSADKNVLSGGQTFPSDFGTFVAPNISMSPDHGIGDWTVAQFANAVLRGVSPDGRHYYPAFPYTSYVRMEPQDVVDLWAYWQTLPASEAESQPPDVRFPFSIRRSVGVWKALFLSPDWVETGSMSDEERHGRYLVEALGHCGECHTPRGVLGQMETGQWLAGAANPNGPGRIPGLTPDQLSWSSEDIAYYLDSGFTPDFDSAGGHMVAVVENFAELPPEDRAAVAAYIKAIPPGQ